MHIDWAQYGIKRGNNVGMETISRAQRILGVELPSEFIDLLLYANGASPEISTFCYGDVGTCVSDYFELSEEAAPYNLLWYSRAGIVPFLPEKFLPIARDAGGLLICLNFREKPPSVEIFDDNSGLTFFVASDFTNFIGLWHE